MESKFYCKDCDSIFESEGVKKDYQHPVFGPCVSVTSNCPDCKNECKEYSEPKQFKAAASSNIPPCGNPNTGCACCG